MKCQHKTCRFMKTLHICSPFYTGCLQVKALTLWDTLISFSDIKHQTWWRVPEDSKACTLYCVILLGFNNEKYCSAYVFRCLGYLQPLPTLECERRQLPFLSYGEWHNLWVTPGILGNSRSSCRVLYPSLKLFILCGSTCPAWAAFSLSSLVVSWRRAGYLQQENKEQGW